MTTKVYAKAPDVVPVSYFTPGKLYPVLSEEGRGFEINYDDCADPKSFRLWSGCGHLLGGNWERVEIDEPEYTGSRYNRLTVIELEADREAGKYADDREALDAAIEAARGDRTKPVTLPLLDRAKLIEALEWALNEINGKTRYETDEQFENALSHTVSVLEKAKREAAMDTLLAIDGELL